MASLSGFASSPVLDLGTGLSGSTGSAGLGEPSGITGSAEGTAVSVWASFGVWTGAKKANTSNDGKLVKIEKPYDFGGSSSIRADVCSPFPLTLPLLFGLTLPLLFGLDFEPEKCSESPNDSLDDRSRGISWGEIGVPVLTLGLGPADEVVSVEGISMPSSEEPPT